MEKNPIPEADSHLSDIFRTWMNVLGTTDPNYLQRRLLWDEIQSAAAGLFLNSLLNPDTSATFPVVQAWLRGSTPIRESDETSERLTVSFVDLWRRLASGGMVELVIRLPKETAIYYQVGHDTWGQYERIRRDVYDDLVVKLSAVGEPVLWKEFNERRHPSDVIMAHLGADGSAKSAPRRTIYCSFLEELRRDGLHSITETYPVLKRCLCITIEHWLQYSEELLTRAYRDHDLLCETFGLPIDAKLTAVRQNLSDPHRGGRTVSLLTFTSASSFPERFSIVYKPKDLRIDHAFQTMLPKITPPTPADDSLRSIRVLVRYGYGYMEWVPHSVCKGDQELRRFYRNAGRLTAILHLLGCTDCHHENLIACNEDLVLIDGETLFEGIPSDHSEDSDSTTLRSGLYKEIGNSVIRLGLLPQWDFVGKQRLPRDISALGIQPPQTPYQRAVGWIGTNSDGMIAGEIDKAAYLPASLPVGVGSPNRLFDFLEEFCDGFKGQLDRISQDKDRWLGDNGHLARFREYQRRFIPRPTWLYIWLHKQQIEPLALFSEVNQRLELERLARSYLVSTNKPLNWPLFAAEVAQMENLDIPFFEQSIDGLDFVVPNGPTIAQFFEISGYENACQKLQQLRSTSIDRQVTLVRGVITAKNMHAHIQSERVLSDGWAPKELHPEERSCEAEALGELLVHTSITDDKGAVEWLGIDVAEDTDRSRYGPLELSLYAGRSGIALFLAALAERNGANRTVYRRTALGACSDVQRLLTVSSADDCRRWWRDLPLGLAGAGGILLALLHIKRLLPELGDRITNGVAHLLESLDVDLLRADQRLDIVYGGAGLIGPLLNIGSARAVMLAQAAGTNLVGRQDRSGGWVINSIGETALTGFSHGASGMGAALARLHSLTGRSDYLEAAASALHYERAKFDSQERNWPDCRGEYIAHSPRFMLSWCHGAPGIALSRLCMSDTCLWDRSLREELEHALGSTANHNVAGDSVCCGRFGRAAILRLAARDRNEPRWLSAAVRLEAQGLNTKRAEGAYSFRDTLGLFTGAAGVGLALIDSISSEKSCLLPSILSAGLYDSLHSTYPQCRC